MRLALSFAASALLATLTAAAPQAQPAPKVCTSVLLCHNITYTVAGHHLQQRPVQRRAGQVRSKGRMQIHCAVSVPSNEVPADC